MNSKFSFCTTDISGLFEITPFNVEDSRGKFTKDYSRLVFANNCISYDISEIFYTTSHKGVIRALHFQRNKQQPKLVRCLKGKIFDVVVDLRPSSITFKKWISFDLSEINQKEILIPGGCAHGYLVLEDSIVSYKCSESFCAEFDDGIKYDDPDLSVDWPYESIGGKDKLIISEKDYSLQTFREFINKYGGLQ